MSVETETAASVARSNCANSSRRLHRIDAANRNGHDRPRVRRSAVQHRLRVRRVPRSAGRRRIPRLVARVDGRSAPRAQAGRHVLAGDRRRVRGRAEGRRRAQDRLRDAQLGRVVLHVRRELQEEVFALARPSVPLREGRKQLHVQRRRPAGARAVGAGAGVCRQAGEPGRSAAGRHLGICARKICRTVFSRSDDTWYFARVAGTFKERRASTAARCRSSCWAASFA